MAGPLQWWKRLEKVSEVPVWIHFSAAACIYFSHSIDVSNRHWNWVFKLSEWRKMLILFRNWWYLPISTTAGWGLTEELRKHVENVTASESVLLDCSKLDSVCTDGAPTLTGRSTGCVALLDRFLYQQLSKIPFYCHWEAFCTKDLDFARALIPTVCFINTVLMHTVNQCFLQMWTGGN